MKKWRFLGFDDGFTSFSCRKAHLVGCVTSGSKVEGFLHSEVDVDGFDVTERMCELVNNSKFKIQLRCIFLYGITFAGMNVVDIKKLHEETKIPVVSIVRRKPDMEKIRVAAEKAGNAEERMRLIENAGKLYRFKNLYIQIKGCEFSKACEFIKASIAFGSIPECLRVAHLVASALAYGESKKK